MLAMGCTTVPKGVQTIPASADVTEQISSTEDQMQEARNSYVDVLSPRNFRRASYQLREAADARSDNASPEVILRHVAFARAWLAEARDRAQVSATVLPNVMRAREFAIKADAPENVHRQFADADYALMRLSKEIERGQIPHKVEKKGRELAADFRALEVKATTVRFLGEANSLLQRAMDEGAKSLAPRTLGLTRQKIQAAENEIAKDPRNVEPIKVLSSIAEREANHLLKITREAKNVTQLDPEAIVLRREFDLGQLAELRKVQAKESVIAKQLVETRDKMQSLQANLMFNEEMQNRIEELRSQFAPEEADILVKDHSVIVRLRALTFPSGSAQIRPDQYELMERVRAALRDANAKSVVVEGHTDALGNRKVNEELSQLRANAVTQFLSAGDELADVTIVAVGKGFDEPLTHNKSSSGRALNRRIDLIIGLAEE